jgi:hypothetical protein
MSSEYTNQHFVPRCYLRGFSFGKKKNPMVYVYDKLASKSYTTPIHDICCEEDLYTINDTQLSEEDRKKYFEVNYLKKEVEDSYGPCLEDIVSKLSEKNTLTVPEKVELAHYIAIQYLRLPIIKSLCSHIQNGLFSDIDKAKALISEYEKDNPHVMRYYYDDSKAHYTNGYGNEGTINNLTCLFGLARWDVIYSPNNIFTSDYPVFVIPQKFEIYNDKIVLNKKFEKFLFPISKDYLLTIEIDPDASYYQNNLCIVKEASEMELLRYNLFQFLFCRRFVIKNVPFDEKELEYIRVIQNNNIIIYD